MITLNRTRTIAILLVVLLFAGMLRAIGLSNGLPYNQVTDESEAISAALNLAAGHKPTIDIYIRVGWQVAELSILGPFYIVQKLAHSNFKTADFESLYFTRRGDFILLVRIFAAALTVLAVLIIFFGGWFITKTRAGGLLAALLLAIQPFGIYIAHFALSDNMALLGVSLALVASLWIMRTGVRLAYILGGVGLTLAMLGHLQSVFVVIALGLAHLIFWWRQPARSWKTLFARSGWAIFAFAISQVVLNPYLILDFGAVVRDIQAIYNERFSTASTLSARLHNLQVNLPLPVTAVRPYLAVIALGAVLLALIRRQSEPLIIAAFWLIFSATLLPAPNPRITFWLEAIVPVVLLTVYVILTLEQTSARWQKWLGRALTVIVIGGSLIESGLIDRAQAATSTRSLAYSYITRTIPAGSRILIGDTFSYGVPLTRTTASIQRLQLLGNLPPSYSFQLSHPALILQPEYDLFGGEYQSQITDHTSWWTFVRTHQIQYVIQADYCSGSPDYQANSIEAFPVIEAETRDMLIIRQVFSPFATDSCEQPIADRTPLEQMNLADWERSGPIVRIYQVPTEF